MLQDPRRFDTPAMTRALQDPANRRPLREGLAPGEDLFEVDEFQFVDQLQAAELRRLLCHDEDLTTPDGCGILDGLDLEEDSHDPEA